MLKFTSFTLEDVSQMLATAPVGVTKAISGKQKPERAGTISKLWEHFSHSGSTHLCPEYWQPTPFTGKSKVQN